MTRSVQCFHHLNQRAAKSRSLLRESVKFLDILLGLIAFMMAESRRLFVTDTPQRFNITPDVHKPDDITACPVEDAL